MQIVIQFLRIYLGYALSYGTVKLSLYTLNTLFTMVDEIVDTNEIADIDNNKSNNTNQLPKGSSDIERGGQNKISPKIKNLPKKIIKPVSIIVATLIKKFPGVKKIYDTIKILKIALASMMGILTLRVIARFDYWALIFCDGIPNISGDQKEALASIRRMRIGIKNVDLCNVRTQAVLDQLADNQSSPEEKRETLSNLFSFYQFLPENHVFKNAYFTCIIGLLLSLFMLNKDIFKLAIKVLLRLLREGKISLSTYIQIVAQLLIGGISPIEIPEYVEN